jgi:hypothetical protein
MARIGRRNRAEGRAQGRPAGQQGLQSRWAARWRRMTEVQRPWAGAAPVTPSLAQSVLRGVRGLTPRALPAGRTRRGR